MSSCNCLKEQLVLVSLEKPHWSLDVENLLPWKESCYVCYALEQAHYFDHILHVSCIRSRKLWLVRLIFSLLATKMSIFEFSHPLLDLVFLYPVAESHSPNRGKSSGQQAIFKVNVTLSIPNIAMVPALEDVQQALNRAVECVVSIGKGVGQWSKERISKVCFIWWQKQ